MPYQKVSPCRFQRCVLVEYRRSRAENSPQNHQSSRQRPPKSDEFTSRGLTSGLFRVYRPEYARLYAFLFCLHGRLGLSLTFGIDKLFQNELSLQGTVFPTNEEVLPMGLNHRETRPK